MSKPLISAWFCLTAMALASAVAVTGHARSRRDLDYVAIPPGTFTMGCVETDTQCEAHERPAHSVTLPRRYLLSRTEVTVEAFRMFADATGYRTRAEESGHGRAWRFDTQTWDWVDGLSYRTPLKPHVVADDQWPAVQVAWDDALVYCLWAGGRLPTEAEWEAAARAGHYGERFPWGNAPTPLVGHVEHANGPDESMHKQYGPWAFFKGYDDHFATLAPVGSFAANKFGLVDLAGNAWEWVADWYAPDTYTAQSVVDPRGPATGKAHVARGGSWAYAPEQHRSSERGFAEQGFWTMTFGFRCARDR